jgi:membrane dipeptidase
MSRLPRHPFANGGRIVAEPSVLIKGFRMICRTRAHEAITNSETHDWADSAVDQAKHHGLTQFGEQVVREAYEGRTKEAAKLRKQ